MSGTDLLRRWVATRTAPVRGDGRGWVLTTVAVGWFITLGLRFVIPALLPQIKDSFTVGNAEAGLAVTVIWLTYAGMQLPAGALVDRLGERVLLTGSLLLAGVSLVAIAAFPSFGLFLLAMALFGLGTGLFGPARGTVLSNTFRENDGMAFGATLAMGSIGAAALPFVATQVTVSFDWRVAVAAFAPVFGVIAVATWWAVPDHRTPQRDGGTRSALRDRLRAVVRAATRRQVVVAGLGAMFMLFTFQGLTAFYTTYLVEVKNLSDATAAGLFALLFVAGAGFQSIAGRAADRFGHGPVLAAVALLGIPPLAAMPLVEGRLALAAVTLPIGIRLGVGPVVNAYVISVIPADVQGTTWGLVRTVFFAVGSTGSIAVGVLADAGQFDLAIYGLAALTAPAIAIFVFLPDRDGRMNTAG
jgi:predicted MFS family arabinose efflux permease